MTTPLFVKKFKKLLTSIIKETSANDLIIEGKFETMKKEGLPCATAKEVGGNEKLYSIYNKGKLVEVLFSSDRNKIIQKLKKLQEVNNGFNKNSN